MDAAIKTVLLRPRRGARLRRGGRRAARRVRRAATSAGDATVVAVSGATLRRGACGRSRPRSPARRPPSSAARAARRGLDAAARRRDRRRRRVRPRRDPRPRRAAHPPPRRGARPRRLDGRPRADLRARAARRRPAAADAAPSLCTSAFLITLGGHPGGLSAAHCGGLRSDGTTQRRNAALRRPPQPGIVLGRVQRNLARTRPLDALVAAGARPGPAGRRPPSSTAACRVRRGSSPAPRGRSAGAASASPGRTSGVDQCGVILSRQRARDQPQASRFAGTRVRCTTIMAREGDSGGPVYTAPARRRHGPRGRHHDARRRALSDDVLHADRARARRARTPGSSRAAGG